MIRRKCWRRTTAPVMSKRSRESSQQLMVCHIALAGELIATAPSITLYTHILSHVRARTHTHTHTHRYVNHVQSIHCVDNCTSKADTDFLSDLRCYGGCDRQDPPIPKGTEIRFAGPGNASCIAAVSAINAVLSTATLVCASKQEYSDRCVGGQSKIPP